MELSQLQTLFYEVIFNPKSTHTQTVCQHITTAKNLTPAEGLAIYQGSVMGKLTRTLKAIYPVCYRLVGEKFFDATATNYVHRFPSYSADLGDYGELFPTFLAEFEPAAQLPYLPDVARLEWHWHRIFNGEDTSTLDLVALTEIPKENWGKLIFSLPKSSALLTSPYPIHRIWQVNQPDYQGDEQVNLAEGGIKIFIWRQGYDMRIDLPNEEEWQLLYAFQTPTCFETVCDQLSNDDIDVPSLLPHFVQQGWIAQFSI